MRYTCFRWDATTRIYHGGYKLFSKVSLLKAAAAIGVTAGSAAAIHSVTATPPSLPTSQVVPTTTTISTASTQGQSAKLSQLAAEEKALQSELNAAQAALAAHPAQQAINRANDHAVFLRSSTTTIAPPSVHASTGASSVKGSDDSSRTGGDSSSSNDHRSGDKSSDN